MKLGFTTKAIASIPAQTPVAVVGPDEHDGLFRVYTTSMETARAGQEFVDIRPFDQMPSVEAVQLLALKYTLPPVVLVVTTLISSNILPPPVIPRLLSALAILADPSDSKNVALHLIAMHRELGAPTADILLHNCINPDIEEAVEPFFDNASQGFRWLRTILTVIKKPVTSYAIDDKEMHRIAAQHDASMRIGALISMLRGDKQ